MRACCMDLLDTSKQCCMGALGSVFTHRRRIWCQRICLVGSRSISLSRYATAGGFDFHRLTTEQDPLYLPCNSELQVSIWRLTDQRRVWYEWYAEAFLPVMIPLPDRAAVDGLANIVASVTTPIMAPSPIVDALDVSHVDILVPLKSSTAQGRLVKIGQTALHNPGGRSSWIGL